MDFFYFFKIGSSFITDYNLFATIDLGLLAIITIVFGLTSLRKQIDDDFNNELNNGSGKKISKKRRDVLITLVKEEIRKLKTLINKVSWWFRKCIYINLFALLLILVSSVYAIFVFDFMISLILVFSLIIICANIHRLKEVMDLDTKFKIEDLQDKLKSADAMRTLDLKSRFEIVLKQSREN